MKLFSFLDWKLFFTEPLKLEKTSEIKPNPMSSPLSLQPWHLQGQWIHITLGSPSQGLITLSVQKFLPMSNLFSSQIISFSWYNALSAILHTTQTSSVAKSRLTLSAMWKKLPSITANNAPYPLFLSICVQENCFQISFLPNSSSLSSQWSQDLPGLQFGAAFSIWEEGKRGWEALIKWHFSFCLRSIMSG